MTTTDAAPPVIRLSAVAYTYAGPPPVRALRPTDLVIQRGEHVAITGPSGSGKSTLLNLLGLLDRPTEGVLEIDGIDVGSASERDRAAVRAHRIGFVFQSFHLLPHRTSAENVMLAQVYADMPRRRRLGAALAALAQVGLEHRAHALPTALSGGERQRVAIARALVNHPSLLLCDEPTGNLDTATTRELTDLLVSLHEGGTTLVIITHNPAVAGRAERRVTIRDGQLGESPDDGPGGQDDTPGGQDGGHGGQARSSGGQDGLPGGQGEAAGGQDTWPGRPDDSPGGRDTWPGGQDGEHETRQEG
jgi:putative ABC transport system ATP-binding protein